MTGIFWMGSRATAAALDGHGIVTVATVESKRSDRRRVRTSDGTRTETDYLVTYAFEAVAPEGGAPIGRTIEHEVPRRIFDEIRSGQEIEIRYLPEDPARADFYPGESAATTRVLGWVMATMLASAGAVLGVALVAARKGGPRPFATGPVQSV